MDPARPVVALVDAAQIEQALANLVLNAIQASAVAAPGLYVWEATAREADWARELAAFLRALAPSRHH